MFKKNNNLDEQTEIHNPLDDFIDDIFENNMGDKAISFKNDVFLKNEYISRTIKKYNYDYKRLMNRLTMGKSPHQIEDALSDCEISFYEYYYPTDKTFEILREYFIYGIKPKKKYSSEPDLFVSPAQDIFDDIFEHHLENETWNGYDFFLDDDHISNTLRKYHNNYGRLMKRLFIDMDKNQIKEILDGCGISEIDFNNPSPEEFEILRNHIMNNRRIKHQ